MKKLFLFCLFSLSFCAHAQDYSAFAAVNTIQSGFTMEKHLSIAVRPLISKGQFYFERPGFLRWEYEAPFPSGILLDGKKAFSWKGKGEKKDVSDVSNQPFASVMAQQIYMFVSMDIEEISRKFSLSETNNVLTLTPKDTSDRQAIAAIKLFINAQRNALTKVEMLEKSGDKTIINFNQVLLNGPISPAVKTPYDQKK